MREHEPRIVTQRGDAQEPSKYPKEHPRNDPEASGNSNVPEYLAGGIPVISKNDQDRRAMTPDARHYQNEQKLFVEKSDYIKAHAVWIRRRAQLVCKTLMPDRPTTQRGEHQNRVDWASDLEISV